ncbi:MULTISPECIES: heptaprenyl diphosphate synthase component 1 [Ureibacillus]|jgi:heptaprenyl diphosphate synthase|uniref:Heptaprenyl diphosphate synthase n=1 Tax=Ureibacillus thermosphaericus TaxID=51173 RepID=A0A840PRC2_URETH|nr:heptaprenyl diphosphate synthase component 1 [Ureibacillus thermosphaericus]MBB5147684.1 heptaprenyl diphosphate synthase [Ureibacillus thermosphaericus]NKZ30512.1 heptaprenyl diphosphate synthase component 1 [Ureibacillus thermosphaericus]
MDATYIKNHIEQLKKDIYRYVQHKTLLKYTGNPLVDENQLFYMLLPFFNGDHWDDEKYEGIITVGIVQASLAEHGLINEYDATSKEQQLTVLSGDYYSGRYYEILANSGNISLIRQLSESVVLRSEHEIRVYEPRQYAIDDWLDSITVIETECISRFYQLYNYDQYLNIMQINLLILRLQNELLNYREGNSSLLLQKMIESFVPVDHLNFEQYLLKKLDVLIQQLQELLRISSIKAELKQYIAERLIR